MANANGWGDGASNNNIGWGKGADNAIGWGDIHADSYAGLTDIVGTASFSNTKSISLDGIDDIVTMGDVLNMANDGTNPFSYSVWFKTTDLGSSQFFIGKQRNAGFFNGVGFYMRGDLKILQFALGTSQSNQWVRGKTGTIADINDGNWHHACLTYDGSQLLSGFTLYYDNNSLAILPEGTQGTPTNVSTAGLADFMIGARGTAASIGLPFNGNLDEVSYFTSELSSGDVSTIYNSGIPNDISSLNSIGWWRCGDGDTSPILTDNGSGGNNGTMTNFTTFSTDVPI
jgi:hypothetical protein